MEMNTGELTEFATDQQWRFDCLTPPDRRKERGQFGTTAKIAQFMAGMFSNLHSGNLRIFDPGAGVGTLSAAICERVLAEDLPVDLFFELWENDPKAVPLLELTMKHCQKALRSAGHEMTFIVRVDDFILANSQYTRIRSNPAPAFHLGILNPPYFKLRKESQHAQAMKHVVHGQPNIYALFMAVAADLLLPNGELVAITPRSYFNGPYFKRFRNWFFDRMTARQIHIFDSRSEAFKNDAVLQENVILHAEKDGQPKSVALTSSVGQDLDHVQRSHPSYDKVIDNRNGNQIIRVSTSRLEDEVLSIMDGLPQRFMRLGFEISTGPVVAFRCTKFLRHERAPDTAPLLWMSNVRPFITQFPPKNGKPSHIEVSFSSKKLLLPTKTYVLLKRFTAKEEKRRLVAGIMTAADSYSEWVGLENHLNYVYRKWADLTDNEAYGLAAFFNSALVDRYFRAISGNTQVNATEIRAMPLPDQEILKQIGMRVRRLKARRQATIEKLVGKALGLSENLMNQLNEVAT